MGGRRRASCLALLAFFGALPVAVGAGDAAGSGHTATLTRTDFDKHIEDMRDKGRPCLVMFHVNWCKVCQRTFPKFANASDQAHAKGLTLNFAHVDCTDDKTLCTRFNVKGYPTIKFFPPTAGDGEAMSYRGQRTEEGFLKYAERMTRSPILAVASQAALTSELKDEALAAFVAVSAGGEHPEGLLAAARRWQDLHLFAAGKTLAAVLPESIRPPAGASLAAYSWGKQQWPGVDNTSSPKPVAAFYTGSLDDEEAVVAWVEKNRFPGLWSLDASTFYFFTHANRSAALVAMDPAKVSASQEKSLREVGERLKDTYLFGVVDGVAWADELTDFNIHKQHLPRVFVTENDFDTWVEDVDALRFESLEVDLGILAKGAPLLRQDRGTVSRLLFYKREAARFARQALAYARTGPLQAAAVVLGAVLALVAVGLFGWCVLSCCRVLMLEDPEWQEEPHRAKKRN